MGLFDSLFGSSGVSLNNLLSGAGTIASIWSNPVGSVLSGAGKLLGSIFGENTVSSAGDVGTSLGQLNNLYASYGIDPSKPFVTSEETRDSWGTNYGRNQFSRAQNLQTLMSSRNESLNNALSQLGLSSNIGASASKLGVSLLAPLFSNYDAEDAALTSRYADPLRTTYEDRMKGFQDIIRTGLGTGSHNYTQQYRTSELMGLEDLIKSFKIAKDEEEMKNQLNSNRSGKRIWNDNYLGDNYG